MAWRSERSMWSVDSVAAKVVVVQLASSRPVSPSFAPFSPFLLLFDPSGKGAQHSPVRVCL